jgi:hypothetical protein
MSFEDAPQPTDEMPPRSHLASLGNVCRAAWSDFRESEQKAQFIGSTALTAGLGAIGATRLPTALIPAATFGVLERTHSVAETAAAAAVMFGTWAFAAAKTLNLGMSQYPRAVEVVRNDFSPAVEVLADSLPGLEKPAETGDEPRHRPLAGRAGDWLLTHTRRGFTALAIGATPYVAVSRIHGKPQKDIHRLTAVACADTAGVAGLLSATVAEAIIELGESNPELAHRVQTEAGNTKVLMGFAGTLMLSQLVANRRRKRLMRRDQQEDSLETARLQQNFEKGEA